MTYKLTQLVGIRKRAKEVPIIYIYKYIILLLFNINIPLKLFTPDEQVLTRVSKTVGYTVVLTKTHVFLFYIGIFYGFMLTLSITLIQRGLVSFRGFN